MTVLAWLTGLTVTLGVAAVSGLASDEIRARLEQLPHALLSAAVRRLPYEIRADVGDEWTAELDHILHRVQAYPLTRLLYGIHFALGLLRTAPKIGSDLISARPTSPPAEQPRDHPRNASAPKATRGHIRGIRWAQSLRNLILVLSSGAMSSIIFTWRLGVSVAVVLSIALAIRQIRYGTDTLEGARKRTRRCLSRLRRSGYICLDACTIPASDDEEVIDHLVIGPAGIYALTSQSWKRHVAVRASTPDEQIYHGQTCQVPALEHARRQATIAAELISAEAGREVAVQPALVIYGPRLFRNAMPLRGVARLRGVDVLGPRTIRAWLRRAPGAMPAADISCLAAATTRALPAPSLDQGPQW
jgi:Nuclease-related domain